MTSHQENTLNRSSVNQRLPQIIFAALALVALLVAAVSGIFSSPPPAGAAMPLTIANLDASLPWLGRLFSYHVANDPAAYIECTDTHPTACPQLALRDSGDARVRDLLAIMLTDYGTGKLEQANLVLGYDDAHLATADKSLAFFTQGVPVAGSGSASILTNGRYVDYSVISIAQYLRSNDPTKRAALLQRAQEKMFLVLQVDPSNPNLRYDMGMVELISGHPQMAIEHLEAANRLDPRQPNKLFALGFAYLLNHQPQSAVDALRPLAVAGTTTWQMQEEMADAALLTGDVGLAMQTDEGLLRYLYNGYVDWQVFDKYIGAALASGRYQQAIDTINLLLTNQPKQTKLYNDRAALQAMLGRKAAALADYDTAIALDPSPAIKAARSEVAGDGLTFASDVPAYYAAALKLQADGKKDEAIAAYQKLLGNTRAAPYLAAVASNLAALYIGDKRYNDAIALFNSSGYDLSKPLAAGLLFYPYLDAAAAYEGLGQSDQVDAAYARALQISAANPISDSGFISVTASLSNPPVQQAMIHSLWGDSLVRAGRNAEAVYHYRTALDRWPISYATWHNLGVAYSKQGQPDLAEAAWLKAQAINPGYPPSLHALAGLSYARGDIGGGDAMLAGSGTGRADRWSFDITPVSSLSAYVPPLGANLAPRSALPDHRLLILAALLITMAVISFIPLGNRRTTLLRWAWLAGVIFATLFFTYADSSGVINISLLALFYPSGPFLNLGSPLALWLTYATIALLTVLLLYGFGTWLQLQVAKRLGLDVQHDTSLLSFGVSVAVSLISGIYFGPLLHLRTSEPPREVASFTPSRRDRLRRSVAASPDARAEQRRLITPHLVGLGFGLAVALIFRLAYLFTGLPSLRYATLIAAALFASESVSGLGALGESVSRYNGWLWLTLVIIGAVLYGGLLTGLI